MSDPMYVVHDRMAVRQAGTQGYTQQRQTADLYLNLRDHILQVYPDPGPLRSTSLRKLAESLNDVLDHDQLMRAYQQHRVHQSSYQEPLNGT